MSRPRLMKTLPHGPTIASMTPAIEGEATRRKVGAQQHAVRQHGDQHEQAEDAEEAQHRGDADVVAVLCVPRVDAGAFDADEQEDGDQHRGAHLAGDVADGRRLAAPEIQREDVGLEAGDGDDDEDRDRHDLGEGGDGVERRRFLDAAQDQQVHAPQQGRRRGDGDRRGAVAEDREELAERGLDQDETGDVGQAAADPVADRRGEAEIVAEARLGVGVDAGVELGLAARQASGRRTPASACRRRRWSRRSGRRGRRSPARTPRGWRRCPSRPSSPRRGRPARAGRVFVLPTRSLWHLMGRDVLFD